MNTSYLQLVFAHIDEAIPTTFLNYAKPQGEVATLSLRQIQKWKSRRIAYFLLHQLCERNNIDPTWLYEMHKTTSGRPYILHPEIDFNISHSGEWVAVIFSRSTPKIALGIDIEHPQKVRNYRKLLRYYAHTEEIVEIEQAQYLPQLKTLENRFYLSWCLREAVLKAQGVGIIKLSEVAHSLSRGEIKTQYSPQGKLFFWHSLPFYLACFVEQPAKNLWMPTAFQWQSNQLQPITLGEPIIYQVN